MKHALNSFPEEEWFSPENHTLGMDFPSPHYTEKNALFINVPAQPELENGIACFSMEKFISVCFMKNNTPKKIMQRKKHPGRPRSPQVKQRILTATWQLMEEQGIRDMTIDSIAQEAGVGKTTIYRWWENKMSLACESLLEKVDIKNLTKKFSEAENNKDCFEQVINYINENHSLIFRKLLAEALAKNEAYEVFHKKFLFAIAKNVEKTCKAKTPIYSLKLEVKLFGNTADISLVDSE